MTGFNLPPGCSVSDLPGNTPAEQAEEAAFEQLCEELEVGKLIDPEKDDEEWVDHLVQFIMRKQGEAYGQGYQAAVADQKEYEDLQETERLATEWRSGGKAEMDDNP